MADSNRDQAIKALQAYRVELQTTLKQTQFDLEAVDRSIVLLGGDSRDPRPVSMPHALGYGNLGPQDAVATFLGTHPGEEFKPSVIARALIKLGCQPTNPDVNVYVTQVRTACIRLVQKGLVEQTEVGGKAAFRWKEGRLGQQPLQTAGQSKDAT